MRSIWRNPLDPRCRGALQAALRKNIMLQINQQYIIPKEVINNIVEIVGRQVSEFNSKQECYIQLESRFFILADSVQEVNANTQHMGQVDVAFVQIFVNALLELIMLSRLRIVSLELLSRQGRGHHVATYIIWTNLNFFFTPSML